MKSLLAFILALLICNQATSGPVDKGIVIGIDGKGGFEVATENWGIIKFQASQRIMGDRPEDMLPSWPDVYKNLMKGDYLEMTWSAVKGKPVARGLLIIKRRG
jgi:hypothetical protein